MAKDHPDGNCDGNNSETSNEREVQQPNPEGWKDKNEDKSAYHSGKGNTQTDPERARNRGG